jgi:hypothetical protein
MPYSPSTSIKLSLAARKHVSVKIYDTTGTVMIIVVDRVLDAGVHILPLNTSPSNMKSGVYFYKIVTDSLTETKKMLLVK